MEAAEGEEREEHVGGVSGGTDELMEGEEDGEKKGE